MAIASMSKSRRTPIALALITAALLSGSAQGQVTVPGAEPPPVGGPPAELPPQPTPPAAPGTPAAPPGTPTPPPSPPGGAQKQLDDKIKAYFLGEWRSQITAQGAVQDTQLLYREDGSISGTVKLTQYGYTGTYPVSGSYTLQAITDTRFILTLLPQGSAQSSAELQIVDQNTLFNRQANYYAYRVTQ